MPEFSIPGGVLNYVALNQVATYMVWPDGVKGAEMGRHYGEITTKLVQLREGLSYIRSDEAADLIEQSLLIPDTIRKDSEIQINRGMYAAVVLDELLKPAYHGGDPKKLTQVLAELTAQDYHLRDSKNPTGKWAKFFKGEKFNRKSLQDAWYAYRSVAHLYSAFFYVSDLDDPFPCRLPQLPGFLGVAEDIRRLGESQKLGKKTVLVPGSTWRVPDSVNLPPVQWRPESITN